MHVFCNLSPWQQPTGPPLQLLKNQFYLLVIFVYFMSNLRFQQNIYLISYVLMQNPQIQVPTNMSIIVELWNLEMISQYISLHVTAATRDHQSQPRDVSSRPADKCQCQSWQSYCLGCKRFLSPKKLDCIHKNWRCMTSRRTANTNRK